MGQGVQTEGRGRRVLAGRAALWTAAFALALALHAAAFVWLAIPDLAPELGEVTPDLILDLAPAGAPGTPSPDPPAEAATPAALPEPVLDAPPDPEDAPPAPSAMAEQPLPPDPAPAVTAEPVTPPPMPEPAAAVAVPKPRTPPPVPRPKPPIAERRPSRPAQAARAERREERRAAAPASGASGASPAASAGSGSSAASRSSWQAALVAHLRRYVHPQGGLTGAASVRFSVDRGGRVLSASLASSAGNAALDTEALAVFRRAQPLPAPPADVPGASFSFTVPIRFAAR